MAVYLPNDLLLLTQQSITFSYPTPCTNKMSCLPCDVGSHHFTQPQCGQSVSRLHSTVVQCIQDTGSRQQGLGIRPLHCVCNREMCIGICKQTYWFYVSPSLLSIITAIPPVQTLPWSLHPCTCTTFPPLPPWLHTSLANVYLVHWSRSAFGLSFLSSRAYSGFLVF